MKKQMLKSALIALAGVGLMSGNAMAYSYFTLTDGFDFQSSSTGNQITIETLGNANEFSFGMFYDINGDGSIASTEKYEIFSGADEQWESSKIYFLEKDGEIYVNTLNNITGAVKFDTTVWGYYFDKVSNNTALYTDSLYDNNVGIWSLGVTHEDFTDEFVFSLYRYNSTSAETLLKMSVKSDDLTAVPEPASLFLFGTGLLGLTTFARRRK